MRAQVEVEELEARDTPDVAPLAPALWFTGRRVVLSKPTAAQDSVQVAERDTAPAAAAPAAIALTTASDAGLTALALSNSAVSEHTPGAVVGKLLVNTISRAARAFSVSDDRFEVVDDELRLRRHVSLDHASEPAVVLRITVTGAGGKTIVRDFSLRVKQVSEKTASLKLDPGDAASTAPDSLTSGGALSTTGIAGVSQGPATAPSRRGGGRRGSRGTASDESRALAAPAQFLTPAAAVMSTVALAAGNPAGASRMEDTGAVSTEISGLVFLDVPEAEAALQGVTVLLERQMVDQYVVVSECRTDIQGRYRFLDTMPGRYRVRLEPPLDLEAVSPGEAADHEVRGSGPSTGPHFTLRKRQTARAGVSAPSSRDVAPQGPANTAVELSTTSAEQGND